MLNITTKLTFLFPIAILSVLTSHKISLAKSNPGGGLSLVFGGGLSTHKSKTVSSNDTATSILYRIKFLTGKNGGVGIQYTNFSTPTSFELNNSKITTEFSDTMFNYHLWNFYFGGILSQSKVMVNNAGTEVFDGLGNGFGAVLGLDLPIAKKSKFIFEVKSVSTSTFKHGSSTEVSIGARSDISIFGKIPISRKNFFIDIGFNYSAYSISISGTQTNETVHTTWTGVSYSVNP